MRSLLALFAFILLFASSACNRTVEIPTPTMPDGWEVRSDFEAEASELQGFEEAMGADLLGVRNTLFAVADGEVQVNTLLAASESDAAAVYEYMAAIKPEEFVLLSGTTVYEFVCNDAMLPQMREGRAHLE